MKNLPVRKKISKNFNAIAMPAWKWMDFGFCINISFI